MSDPILWHCHSDPSSVMTTQNDTNGVWYFAYGSNMHPTIFRGRRGMRPAAARAARLDAYRLCFNLPIGSGERGVGNIEAANGACTWGVVYLLTPAELARLDATEGVGSGAYERKVVDVETPDGERIAAHAYVSTRGCEGRKPSARYIGLLLDGARHHGLPSEYLQTLASFELAFDEREAAATSPTS